MSDALTLARDHARAGRLDEAESTTRGHLAAHPQDAAALDLMSNIAWARRDVEQALDWAQQAAAAAPQEPGLWLHISSIAAALLRMDLARSAIDRALALAPNHPHLMIRLADILTITGDLAGGWRAFRYRWYSNAVGAKRHTHLPEWQGGDVSGKRLLLWSEQGLGDVIQYVRFAAELQRRGASVVLECPLALKSLLVRSPHLAAVRAQGEPLPPVDLQCPLMDAGLFCGTTMESIPTDVPYLSPDPRAVARWKERLGSGGGMRVGLAWSGNPRHTRDAERSVPLALLAPLGAVPGVRFFSLQLGEAGKQVRPEGLEVVDHTSRLTSMEETAALIENLHLVISVDTSVAHLAGALNRPVWALHHYLPDSRWLLGRDDTPWYPSMRLYRQTVGNEWSDVIARIATDLRGRASQENR